MTGNTKCSYHGCDREAWRPIEDEKPFCIFHSPKIEEKRKDFITAWDVFMKEHSNDDGYFRKLDCWGYIFPIDIDFDKEKISDARFNFAKFLGFAIFSNAFLEDVSFESAIFYTTAVFANTIFSTGADFINATFKEGGDFTDAKFEEMGYFFETDFSGSNLGFASFSNCSFDNVKYTLHRKFYLQKPSKWYKLQEYVNILPPTDFICIETGGILAASNRQFVRDIEDQQFITQLKERSKLNRYFWIPLWYMTCDCGRRFSLFFLWCLLVAAIFGDIYLLFAEAWFPEPWKWSAITPFYYSLVTFSTLGFGDVTPRLSGGWAQFTVMVEVFLGYLGLGGLISIFANKLARRA